MYISFRCFVVVRDVEMGEGSLSAPHSLHSALWIVVMGFGRGSFHGSQTTMELIYNFLLLIDE
jgi:hypothetical protein